MGGLLTGVLFKVSLGPKGMISGGFFGILLGSVCGAMIICSLKLTGCKMQDAYDVAHAYFESKDMAFHGVRKVSFYGIYILDKN